MIANRSGFNPTETILSNFTDFAKYGLNAVIMRIISKNKNFQKIPQKYSLIFFRILIGLKPTLCHALTICEF